VYDVLGREAASLVNANQQAGHYSVTFTAEQLPSGVYFYRMSTDGFTAVKKLVLLK